MNKPEQILKCSVLDAPNVEIKMTPPNTAVKRWDTMTLNCNVKRSKPEPHNYTWFKDDGQIGHEQTYVKQMKPEDRGSYTCSATNTVGTGTSEPLVIEVECKFLQKANDGREKEIKYQ